MTVLSQWLPFQRNRERITVTMRCRRIFQTWSQRMWVVTVKTCHEFRTFLLWNGALLSEESLAQSLNQLPLHHSSPLERIPEPESSTPLPTSASQPTKAIKR